MNHSTIYKSEAVIATLLVGAMLFAPVYSATTQPAVSITDGLPSKEELQKMPEPDVLGIEQPGDTLYIPKENVNLAGEQNDLNYNIDAKNSIIGSLFIYPGEPVDAAPGRGRTGTLDPSEGDTQDWYRFTACEGQTIQASIATSQDFALIICDTSGNPVGSSYTVVETGWHFLQISANDGAGTGDYTVSLTLSGQNDAGTGGDAGDTSSAATSLTPGEYTGYMDSSDVEDWYSFPVSSGQGISVHVEPLEKSDYDVHLYNPTDELVHEGLVYGEDTLEYPADATGTWKIQLDIFPGWDEALWPDDYYLYGSGAYNLDLTVGGSVDAPVIPEPQPDIHPVAQTFIIEDDPASNADEYTYLAAVPAANYLEDGNRYVSPIVYQGVDEISTWFTTIDQTTQYLIDDWDTYLSGHGMVAEQIELSNNPVTEAASLATDKWASSDTVVIATDGSTFKDEIETVMDKSTSLTSEPVVETLPSTDEKLNSEFGYTMFLNKAWGAIALRALDYTGSAQPSGPPSTDLANIFPHYMSFSNDWWPTPYDGPGDANDNFLPVVTPGFWGTTTTLASSDFSTYEIIKIPGDRYTIPVSSSTSSIEATVSTDEPSNLMVYLVDPEGNIRRPMKSHYNGGDIKPIHYWNGGHWEHDQDEFRAMIVEPHQEFSVNVHNAMEGDWTAIVVPYDNNFDNIEFNGDYHISINIRTYATDRLSAALSAANAAVIASMHHAPLLYVTKDEVPSATTDAITTLGASNIIFVNIGGVSNADITADEELTTMQQVIDAIKAHDESENFITLISLGTGEGYFAPAAMAAAYHTAPVLNIGEVPEAYNTIDKIAAWREYAGDYYHGCLSVGHLHQLSDPISLTHPPSLFQLALYYLKNKEVPPIGLDIKNQWYGTVATSIQDFIQGYNLDLSGKEAFLFVSPRDTDIRDVACRSLVGNESFAGHIPVETTAFSSAVICRDILYPALIYANPGRDVVTSQMMNYPDGYVWRGNDGNGYPNYASRYDKASYSSRGRFYEGHCIWDNLLERYNTGAVFSYYSGHGTGGSGISAQYKNIAEQFPLAEPRYEYLKDFDWWDSWRGYSGYDDQQTKTCRWGGESGYNSQEPSLYDIIHFKWVDQLFGNLHSEIECWSSCTTGEHWGPIVYLSHGSALWYGAAGSTYGVQDDLHNEWIFHDVLVNGDSFGESESRYQWIFNSDYTTLDPTTLYGRSTLFQGGLTNVKVLYGDPTMTVYAPDWVEPIPIAP
jgi:hypothetical protein